MRVFGYISTELQRTHFFEKRTYFLGGLQNLQALRYPKHIIFVYNSHVRTSFGNDSDVELKKADQLKTFTLDPPAKFGVGGRIWSL